ncbi:MAG: cytidylyltransferase domain-containing protein [Candidatus Magasanikbacteria bacterium]
MSNTGAIVQARMGSTRLPGKMTKKIGDKTVTEHVINRVKKVPGVKKIILAIPESEENDVLYEIGKSMRIELHRGSEDDVLDRFYSAAKKYNLDPIIRVTGDCPLLDPEVVNRVLSLYQSTNCDYVSNIHPRTFPHGLDVEVFSFYSLKEAWKNSRTREYKEHVTPYIVDNKDLFNHKNLYNNRDLSYIRVTLDTKEDLDLIRRIHQKIGSFNEVDLEVIKNIFNNNEELLEINNDTKQNWKERGLD